MAAEAVTTIPAAVDRGWVKACRCTAAVTAGVVDEARAVAELRAVMSGRLS